MTPSLVENSTIFCVCVSILLNQNEACESKEKCPKIDWLGLGTKF